MAATEPDGAILLPPTEGHQACTRDHRSCGPCGAREIVQHGRSDVVGDLIDIAADYGARVAMTRADMALFCARALEVLIRDGGPGLAVARGALLLAEANAKALRHAEAPERRRLHG
ncbi:hypothetical protein [Falsiroseomonas sp. CW058]|uniref:hypothetical protein n=1 Tax=Falsiroseomonas sp. CW058 TaxID=3388664 RepID=UPI003D315745